MFRQLIWLVVFHPVAVASAAPAITDSTAKATNWHATYGEAVQAAKSNRRMLLVVFDDDDSVNSAVNRALATDSVQQQITRFEVVRLSTATSIKTGGNQIRLLSHPAFIYMRSSAGIAVIDYTDASLPTFGDVITQVPQSSLPMDAHKLSVILDLPVATLTQRTLIFAVRIHPESPQSAWGEFSPTLAEEATKHSQLQANLRRQGHHDWDRRFRLISSQLPGGLIPQEVAAESWPGEDLVKGAIECVHSWRRSPGHWSAVSRAQPVFGYDMKLGGNGVWYATGLFGNRTQ